VPTPNVSAVDLTFEAAKSVTVEDVNAAVAAASCGHMGMVMIPNPSFD
jgi:glyceraldehyde 3-phosphate dehydrogenase